MNGELVNCRRRAEVVATDDVSVLPLTHKSRHNFRISVSPDYIRPRLRPATCDVIIVSQMRGFSTVVTARGSAVGPRGPGGRPGGVRPARGGAPATTSCWAGTSRATQDRRGDHRAQAGDRARAGLRRGARRARRALRAAGPRPEALDTAEAALARRSREPRSEPDSRHGLRGPRDQRQPFRPGDDPASIAARAIAALEKSRAMPASTSASS